MYICTYVGTYITGLFLDEPWIHLQSFYIFKWADLFDPVDPCISGDELLLQNYVLEEKS
jgi:hypothetical protein